MSTFDGFIKEFPNIRIDYFRTDPGRPLLLACFLSHVHSDHLQGLESLKSPFVYCSAATRRLLLRMEKYPHRMNFAKGILEARKQHYRHLKLVLKALPLHTPTELELGPKRKIRVTLFDANHCPGAVMFLIEGDDKAVLYTGDLRAEPWWVNSIVRNPLLLPYTSGRKRLHCVYLDTTFASHDEIYRHFPSKAEGLAELLNKVSDQAEDTIFYFRAWTLGYEDVWVALSATLGMKTHVDDYQRRLYSSLVDERADGSNISDGCALIGFQAGNHFHAGCLTGDSNARVHSCEPGTQCHADLAKKKSVVWITPIISRMSDGMEVRELGAGGGGGDLYQVPELEENDKATAQAVSTLCQELISDPQKVQSTLHALNHSANQKLSLESLGLDLDAEISLSKLVQAVSSNRTRNQEAERSREATSTKTIHFPYSRHSSYDELQDFVLRFKPKDICPCTVDLDSWSEEVSMQSLFGELCSDQTWFHDQESREAAKQRQEELGFLKKMKRDTDDNGDTQSDVNIEDFYETAEGSQVQGRSPSVAVRPEPRPHDAAALFRENFLDGPDQSFMSIQQQEAERCTNAIRLSFHPFNEGSDVIVAASGQDKGDNVNPNMEEMEQEVNSELSLSLSDFESQSQTYQELENTLDLQLDGSQDQDSRPPSAEERNRKRRAKTARSSARQEGYKAARRCLLTASSSHWDDLLSSSNHTGAEVEF